MKAVVALCLVPGVLTGCKDCFARDMNIAPEDLVRAAVGGTDAGPSVDIGLEGKEKPAPPADAINPPGGVSGAAAAAPGDDSSGKTEAIHSQLKPVMKNIMTHIRRRVEKCKNLPRCHDLNKMEVSFTVEENGSVSGVKFERYWGGDYSPELEDCIVRAYRSAQFPATKTGPIKITHPQFINCAD